MDQNNPHINKYLRDPLPDPDVPADDAWAGMANMLDVAGGTHSTGSGDAVATGGRLSRILKSIGLFKGFVAVTAALVAVGSLVILNRQNAVEISADAASEARKVRSESLRTAEHEAPGKEIVAAGGESRVGDARNAVAEPARNAREEKNYAKKMHAEAAKPGTTAASDIRVTESPTVRTKPASRSAVPGAANAVTTRPNATGAFRSGMVKGGRNAKARTRDARAKDDLIENANTRNAGDRNAHTTNPPGTATLPGTASLPGTAMNPNITTTIPATAAQRSIAPLLPLKGHFASTSPNLGARIVKPDVKATPSPRKKRSFSLDNVHFGPEWSLYLPPNGSEYLFTGADSIKRPARIAIPGLFISKNWNRHAATFIFTPLHTYFGNRDRVLQQVDTLMNNDSTLAIFTRNAYFLKSTGINLTLQYHFEATSWLSLSAGASYASYSRALIQTETTSNYGTTITDPLLTVKGSEAMQAYVRRQQWTVRAGLIAHPRILFNGRMQIGTNAILPVSNLSRHSTARIRSANAQVFLRLMIR